MTINLATPSVFARLGVKRVINAQSWVTVLGGSIMPPEVLQAMTESANCFVNMVELHRKAGEVVAEITGADAGMVTAGCAAAQVLQAAACMTGTDAERIAQLPDATGMKNEIIIQRGHRNHYDNAFRMAGARIVEAGSDSACTAGELESAISDSTAAVAYVWYFHKHGLPLEKVLEIAHSRSVPVIMDASAELPPVDNLTRFIRMGADMVAFSGGKGIRGPQSTGILAGRKDLMDAAWENAISFDKPKAGIGRPMKVCKEEIIGLVTALELFISTDHEAEWANWYARSETVARAIKEIPGVKAEIDDSGNRQGPVLVLSFDDSWRGPSMGQIQELLKQGDPPIYIGGERGGELYIVPVNVQDGEDKVIADRLAEALHMPS